MCEVIEIATRKSMGIFANIDSAIRWTEDHGGRSLYLIDPW